MRVVPEYAQAKPLNGMKDNQDQPKKDKENAGKKIGQYLFHDGIGVLHCWLGL